MTGAEPFGGSPAAAYRADMAGRTAPFGRADESWLVAANALHLAATTNGRARKEHLFEALGHAIDLLGDEKIDQYVQFEWNGNRSYVESIVALVDTIVHMGAFHLAAIMLDDLHTAAKDLSVVERGRVLNIRARVEWKLDRLDEAVERYQYLATLAKDDRTGELETRAEVGLLSIAQLRGNLPEMRRLTRRVVELAERHGFVSLARLAYQGLTVVAAKDGDYDEAVLAGWTFIELSRGDAAREAEALGHVGQLMLEAGHVTTARACWAAVVARTAPARVVLPALGGLAHASALLGNEATVEWSMREVWIAQRSSVPSYELADALLECAIALATLARHDESDRYRERARQIATAGGLHELVFRAEDLERARRTTAARPSPLQPRATEVSRALSALEPEQLPLHVVFDAAPA